MRAHDYLLGAHPNAIVPDLIPAGSNPTEMLFVFESPHSDELLSKQPLTGNAGKLALNYVLSQNKSPEGLGPWLAQRIRLGDSRAAIVNVSNVPLQEKAFRHLRVSSLKPSLTPADWFALERVRTAKPATWTVAELELAQLLEHGFNRRLDQIEWSASTTVIPCGQFASHFVTTATIPQGALVMPVPHPAYGRWQTSKGQAATNLAFARAVLLQKPY